MDDRLTNKYYSGGMSEVSVRMLNQETARVLARVKQGEEIEVTERGVVVARLLPAQPSAAGRLLATGKLRPRRTAGPVPRPKGPVRRDREAGEVLRELRGEERH